MKMALLQSSDFILPLPLSCKPRENTDLSFINKLVVACKRLELAEIVPKDQLNAVAQQQYLAQLNHYTNKYPNAKDFIVFRATKPVGRFYIELKQDSLRLIDIAIMPQNQKMGVGREVMNTLINFVKSKQINLVLSVAVNNSVALSFYYGLGFNLKPRDMGQPITHVEMQFLTKSL